METKYILSQGIPIEVDSQDLNSKLAFSQPLREIDSFTVLCKFPSYKAPPKKLPRPSADGLLSW